MPEQEETQPSERPMSLLELAEKFSAACLAATAAYEARLALEEKVIAATGFDKPEGQETFEFSDDRGRCKFTLKQPIHAKVDAEAWGRIKASVGGAIARRIMRTKYELATAEARDLQEKDPTTWAKVAECVTRKPGKISVDLSELVVTTATQVEA